jgi:solute:Na+ symporter, SSS family
VAPTLSLAPLDAAVVLLFILAILALGFSARLKENTVLQYLAAGRSLSLPAFVATLVSTWYGGVLGIGESVAWFGMGTWLLLGVPYYLFALIYGFVFAPKVRAAEQLSLPERIASRWGKGAAIVCALLVFLLAVPAVHVLMLGTLVRLFTGWDLSVAVAVGAAIGTLFLYRGGLLADVRVSLLAFVMMYVGFAVIAGWCLATVPPAEAFARIEPPELLTFTGGSGPIVILSFLILGAWTIADPGFHQRVASARSQAIGQRGVFVSVGFWVLFDLLTITTGLYALALLQPLPEEHLQIFPRLGEQVLPPGLRAVFLCGMLGTIVSAMVGYTLVGGATVGREIVARWRGLSADAEVTDWMRGGVAATVVLAVVLALRIPSVVGLWFYWAGALVGALVLPIAAAYLGGMRRVSGGWASASMILSFGTALAWLVYGLIRAGPHHAGNPDLMIEVRGQEVMLGTLIPALAVSAAILLLAHAVGRSRPAA